MLSLPPLSPRRDSCRTRLPLTRGWRIRMSGASSLRELTESLPPEAAAHPCTLPFLQAVPGEHSCVLTHSFSLPEPDGYRMRLNIGAAMMQVQPVINGSALPARLGAYTPGVWDITDQVHAGTNHLELRLVGEQAAFRDGAILAPVSVSSYSLRGRALEAWRRQTGLDTPPPRLGIWQEVAIEQLPVNHITDLRIHPDPESGTLAISGALEGGTAGGSLEWRLIHADTGEELHAGTLRIDPSGFSAELPAGDLDPWSPDQPRLYLLELTLLRKGIPVDRLQTRFGYRSIRIQGDRFLLNGETLQLRGESNLLQNRGYQFFNALSLESPFFWNKSNCLRYFRLLKEKLDLNCLRIHGAIGHPVLFDAADEVGMLLESQSSIWSRGYGGYRQDFPAFLVNAREELDAWIRRDRHHPSIILWGAENEMCRIAPDPETAAEFQVLGDWIREQDPTRPVCFDGSSGALGAQAELHHLHHEESYHPFLENPKQTRPLIFGEFWIGSRGAEQRLESGEDYLDREDYLDKQARLWKRKIEPMRFAGVAGVFPYNFSAQWIREWDGIHSAYRNGMEGTSPHGLRVEREPPSDSEPVIDEDRAAAWRHLLGRYCLGIAGPSRNLVLGRENSARLTVIARNDDARPVSGRIELRDESAKLLAGRRCEVPPATSATLELEWTVSETQSRLPLHLEWRDNQNRLLDRNAEVLYLLRPSLQIQKTAGTLKVVDSPDTRRIQDHLVAMAIPFDRIAGPDDASDCGVVLDAQVLASDPGWWTAHRERGVALAILNPAAAPEALPGIRCLPFREALPYAWKLRPVAGRDLDLADMLLPREAVWDLPGHPAASGLLNPRWEPDSEGHIIADALLMPDSVPLGEVLRTVHGVGAGLDAPPAASSPSGGPPPRENSPCLYRPLLTASRREMAVLAEVSRGGPLSLVSTLAPARPGGAEWIRERRWTANLAEFLSGRIHSEFDLHSADTMELLIQHGPCGDPFEDGIRAVHTPGGVNRIVVDNRGVFAGTQSPEILRSEIPDLLLAVPDTLDILGGWRIQEVPGSFEVKGPLFPWEFRSRHPRTHGYTGLAYVDGHTLRIRICLDRGARPAHPAHLLTNLESLRTRGIPIHCRVRETQWIGQVQDLPTLREWFKEGN